MNKLNIGYDHYEERTNFYNGAPHKDCDWLEYREYYGFDITEVDVNTCGDFYIFPINALWAKFELFEEKTFFGKYLSEKVIKDLQSDKCLLHINWINEVYRFDRIHINRLYRFLMKNNISPNNILISSDNFQFKKDFNKWNSMGEPIGILELPMSEKNIECTTHYRGFKVINEKDAFNDKLRHSHFLSVGFAPHQHRVDLVNFYEKENYNDDKVLWSALWKNKTISDEFHWPANGKQENWCMEMNLNEYGQNPYLHSYLEIVAETVFDGTATQLSAGPFKPMVGGLVNTDHGYYIYAGIRIDLYLTNNIVVTPNFAPGIYGRGDGKELGHVIEFRSGLDLAYRRKNGSRIAAEVHHLSNASLDENNPGTETFLFTYSIPLN